MVSDRDRKKGRSRRKRGKGADGLVARGVRCDDEMFLCVSCHKVHVSGKVSAKDMRGYRVSLCASCASKDGPYEIDATPAD